MTTQTVPDVAESNKAVSTDMLQVVNYEEQFNAELQSFLRTQGIAELGFEYNVAAIMGPQSSGKSTLLNLLFGTTFRTMDAASGPHQVTQGVWMGRDAKAGIIVMDLEGTDSRERGEDAATYERKSALFALALAEVLIVNVWTRDVGRYNAANMSLLKTVIELDLQLFFGGASAKPEESAATPNSQPDAAGKPRMHKTRLLFVLRDYDEAYPFETLCNTLRADVDNIWNTISKPDAAMGTPITNYFDLSFFALPHKVLRSELFYNKGRELQTQFHGGDIFLEEYSRGVAADGFAAYAESVWETIRANRELDIPSQKEMLAHVRCEQIAREAIAAAESELSPLQTGLLQVDGGIAEIQVNLFMSLLQVCNTAVKTYEGAAFRYSAAVAELKGSDLRSKLSGDCKALFDAQIALASDIAIKSFRMKALGNPSESGRSLTKPWEDWGSVSKAALDVSLEGFDNACSTAALQEYSEKISAPHPLSFVVASVATARRKIVELLDMELERATADALAAARGHCLKTFRDSFKPPLNTVLESAGTDVWDRTTEVSAAAWNATIEEAKGVYGEKGLGMSEDKLAEVVEDDIKPLCYENAMTDIKDAVGTPANFLLRMTKRFDDSFRFDERGVPRHFGPTEDIEALFVVAREKGEELIDLLGEIKLKGPLTTLRSTARSIDPDVSQSIILADHSKEDLREKLKRQAGAVFMEAKRAQEAAKITTKVPIWVFILLVILGWNEIMAVLRNPVLLLLSVIILPVLYMGYTLDAPTLLGPAVRATLAPLLDQAREMLEKATEPTPAMANVAAPSTGGVASASSTEVSMNTNNLHKD